MVAVSENGMETLEACPVCENTTQKPYMHCKDYTVSNEVYSIVECDLCGFNFTNPRPSEENIGKYYESEDYVSHSNSSKGIINRAYQIVRKKTLNKKLHMVASLAHEKTILDYGCGTGEFLNHCKLNGWETIGLEPSESARSYGIKNYGLSLQTAQQVFELPSQSFDIITMWHVLEHIHQLKPVIMGLKKLLKQDGTLLVAVPNLTSYDAKVYGEYWAAYDVPRHIYHFRPQDIKKLFEEFQMEVINIMPMKYDAFYVSMLSEKYKNGGNLVNAFLNGLKSNLLASNKEHTWSSQIYVLRKTT